MEFKKEFLQFVSNASDDDKSLKFKELKKKVRSGDEEAKELLDFLSSYEDVSIRYFAKKVRGELLKEKESDVVDSELEVAEILKKLDDSQKFNVHHEEHNPDEVKPINIEALKKYLSSSDYKKRIKAIQGAAIMGDPQAIPVILNMLEEEEHPFVRATIVRVLGSFKDPMVIPVISMYLSDPDQRVRANAIEGLEMIEDPKAVEHVIPLLQDPGHRVRATAAKMLVRFGRKDVMDVLTKMLNSPALWLQESSIYALGEIGTHECFEHLKDKFNDIDNDEVKISIINALQKFNKTPEIIGFLRLEYSKLKDKESVLGLLIGHILGEGNSNHDLYSKQKKSYKWIIMATVPIIILIISFFLYKNIINSEQLKNKNTEKIAKKSEISNKSVSNEAKTHKDKAIDEALSELTPTNQQQTSKTKDLSQKTPVNENDLKLPTPVDETAKEIPKKPIIEASQKMKKTEPSKSVVVQSKVTPLKPVAVTKDVPAVVVPTVPKETVTPAKYLEGDSSKKDDLKNLVSVIDWAKEKVTKEVKTTAPKVMKKKVLTLDEKLSLFGISKKKRILILKSLEKEKKRLKPKILFLYPENNNLSKKINIYSKGITDFLISNFSKIPGVEVVSRENLQSKMLELGLSIRDLGNKDIALKLGEIFNVDFVVYGKLKEIGSNFARYYDEYIKNEPQDDDATKVYIEGNLDEQVFEDVIADVLPAEFSDSRELVEDIARNMYYNGDIGDLSTSMADNIREKVLKRFYDIGMKYYRQHDYRNSIQYFRTAKHIDSNTGNSFEDLDSHLKLAERSLERLDIRNKEKVRDRTIIQHRLTLIDVSTRKIVKEWTFTKKIKYFRNILKDSFDKIYSGIGLPKKRLPDSMLFSGFTNDLEAFLRLYDAIDLMDIDVGDAQVENKNDAVLTLLNKCIMEDSNYADAHYYKAKIFALENNIDKALKEAEQASMLDPSNIRIRYSIVMYRKKLGDKKGSKLELKKISKLKSIEYRSVLSKSHLELAYNEYHNGNHKKALSEIQNALIADPGSQEAFIALGIYFKMKKQYSNSYYAFEEASKISESVYVKILMATILDKMDDTDGMLSQLKGALLIINKDKTYFKDGRYKFLNLDKAPEYPKNAVYFYLGVGFWKKQSKDLAKTYFRQCIEMGSHNDYAYKARKYLNK